MHWGKVLGILSVMRALLLAVLVCLGSTASSAFAANTRAHDFIGVGVVLFKVDGDFVIKRIVPASPAESAGMKVNDRVIKIDDQVVHGLNLSHVLDLSRGAPDTAVKFIVSRPGVPLPMSFTMIRKPIHVDSLKMPSSSD